MDRRSAVCERKTDMPKTHPTYDEDFRRKAVDVRISSVRPLKEVSRDLGISAHSLRQWRDRSFGVHAGRAKTVTSPTPPVSIDPAEIRRLQREVEHLRRQRDILKKAMSILGEEP
jgi:transposase